MSRLVLDNTNFVVKAGFTSMLALTLIFGVFSLYQLKITTFNMTNAIEINSKKITHAILMRDVIRQRQVIMTKIILMNDAFERERTSFKFFDLSGDFRKEQALLIKLPRSNAERKLLNEILKLGSTSQKNAREAIDLLIQNSGTEVGKELILRTQKSQKDILALLGDLINLQNKNIQTFIKTNREHYSQTVSLFILIGIILAFLALLIARVMSKIITHKNEELVIKNKQLKDVSEQALQATRAKSEFLATMSHEIRTPLTSIIGFAEALSESGTDAVAKKGMATTIIKNGKHLLKIINDILDISKTEANKMEFKNSFFSPLELIHEVEDIIKNQFIDKGLQFYIEYDFPLPHSIKNDHLRVKQIILNLCSNALKFTKTGKVSIKTHCDIGSEKIYFTVLDSGIGLTNEQMDKIFNAFTQADSSTTRKYGGTGLGLSLSKQFAEKMGGTITVESLLGVGSQFCVSIKTGKIDREKLIVTESELPEKIDEVKYSFDSSYKVAGKILIAEDNEDNRQLLSILLGDIGADLTFVENGKMAVEKVKHESYDLIFMDMQMPIMGGIEATKIVRKNSYTKPIVALTANAMKSDEEKCIEAGCDGFLTKPINKNKIFQTIYRYLSVTKEKVNAGKIDILHFEKSGKKMQGLIRKFVAGLPLRIKDLEKCRIDNNWGKMKVEIHKIKGIGPSMGFPYLSDVAKELEYEVIKENEIEVDKALCKMKDACKEAENSIT